jgi:hypothetical protein
MNEHGQDRVPKTESRWLRRSWTNKILTLQANGELDGLDKVPLLTLTSLLALEGRLVKNRLDRLAYA